MAVAEESTRNRNLTCDRGTPQKGQWAFPGGHLEFGETYFECAEREALEETGMKVGAVKMLAITNDVFEEAGQHYLTIFVECKRADPDQQPEVKLHSPIYLVLRRDANGPARISSRTSAMAGSGRGGRRSRHVEVPQAGPRSCFYRSST